MGTQLPNIGTITGGYQLGENGWQATMNANLQTVDDLVQVWVLDTTIATPPLTPNVGDRYVVAAAPSGVWVGKAGNIASYLGSSQWAFYAPKAGWRVYSAAQASDFRYNGSTWQVQSTGTDALTKLANPANGQGVDLVAGTGRTVASMAALRLLSKTQGSGNATVLTYYGGVTSSNADQGTYQLNAADTTSGCLFTGSVTGTILTVATVTNGALAVGQAVARSDTGALVGWIISFGTGTGGTGTYNLSSAATISTITMMSDTGGPVIVAADGGRWYLDLGQGLNVKQSGAKVDNVTVDTFALQAVVNYCQSTGTPLFGWPGTAIVNGNGVNISTSLNFDARGMTIKNASGSALQLQGFFVNLSNGKAWSQGGGHTINQSGLLAQSTMTRFDLQQDAAGFALWDCNGQEIVDVRITDFNHTHVLGATAHGFNWVAAGGLINDIQIWRGRATNSGVSFYNIASNTANFQYAPSFQGITFEVCKGGGISLSGVTNYEIKGCQNWDAGVGGITANFYNISTNGSGYGGIGIIQGCGRFAGSNAGGVFDVQLPGSGAGAGTIIDSCLTVGGGDPFSCNLASNATLIRQPLSNVMSLTNAVGAVILNPVDGSTIPTLEVTTQLGIGGTLAAPSATLAYSGGFLNVTTTPNSSGIILAATDGSAVQRKLVWDTSEFYPLTDNSASCGVVSGRWSVVYAATSTINTSDEREKQDTRLLNDKELAVGAALKKLVKAYRWKDAVALKDDGARIHVGWIAQEVIAAFTAQGLDPFAYGVCCYDTWPAQDAVYGQEPDLSEQGEQLRDEEGNAVMKSVLLMPAREAGDRYGVRHDELIAFIIGSGA